MDYIRFLLVDALITTLTIAIIKRIYKRFKKGILLKNFFIEKCLSRIVKVFYNSNVYKILFRDFARAQDDFFFVAYNPVDFVF